GGLLLIVPAGEGAHLAVVAEEDGEVGLIAHNMNELVEQIGVYLTAAPRSAENGKACADARTTRRARTASTRSPGAAPAPTRPCSTRSRSSSASATPSPACSRST